MKNLETLTATALVTYSLFNPEKACATYPTFNKKRTTA